MEISVSICIPTYSRLNYLKKAVESAKAQTYKNIEIFVSQNPKEDGADMAIQNWCEQAASKEEVKYNLNKKNLGLTGNLNVLSKLAKGDYLIFLGDDDLLHPDFVEELIKKTENKQPDIIFCNQVFIDGDGNILDNTTAQLNIVYKRDQLSEGILTDTIQSVFNNSIPLSASLIKKELFNDYSFTESLNTPELPFFLKVALGEGTFFYISRQLAYYRLHKNSETNNGLTTDGLLKEVIDIDVPFKYKDVKRNYIERSIIPSINKAILKGNHKLAEFLLNSEYYPHKPLIKYIQKVLNLFPAFIIRMIFRLKKAI